MMLFIVILILIFPNFIEKIGFVVEKTDFSNFFSYLRIKKFEKLLTNKEMRGII